MKKRFLRMALPVLCAIMLSHNVAAARVLIPGGQIVGLVLSDQTVTVAAFEETLGQAAKAAGLRVGDKIACIDGEQVRSAEDVRDGLVRSKGAVTLSVLREGKVKQLKLHPQPTENGPRLGVYLKEGITGVGTVTWYDPDAGRFGALGHGVNTPQGTLVTMEKGSVYEASVAAVKKGKIGEPGQLMGTLSGSTPVGSLQKNTVQGVFGRLDMAITGQPLPVATAEQIRTGDAVIRSTVSDLRLQEYSVEILKIYPNSGPSGRNMLLKITDPALLEATGGIVQGMSGSPIIQDGKLVGAVTHVLVNDPTTGYGIFIENMLDAAA